MPQLYHLICHVLFGCWLQLLQQWKQLMEFIDMKGTFGLYLSCILYILVYACYMFGLANWHDHQSEYYMLMAHWYVWSLWIEETLVSYDYVSLSKSNVQWLNSSKFLPRVFLFVDYGSPHQNLLLMIGVYGQKTFASLCSNDFLFNWYLMRLMKHNTVCWCFVSFVVD